jgi:predicted ATPase
MEKRDLLARWRADMERAAPLIHLQLGPLTPEDILLLLQECGGKAGKEGKQAANLERFGQWLFVETEGQPFYLMETLKVLLERHVLTSHPNEDGGWTIDFTAALEDEAVTRGFFPPSVREVICSRLDRLTPNAFALLAAGAILHHNITFTCLCQVADLTEHDGLLALDEVLSSHLLYESEHEGKYMTDERYVFAHANIRAVVYAEAGEARRTIFHRRAVQALQEMATPTAQLAYHAMTAGLVEPAFRFSLAAGDEAMEVVAVCDAIAFYEQAQRLLTVWWHGQCLGSGLPVTEIECLFTHLGQAYEQNAEWEKARSTYTSLLAYAQEVHAPVLERTALSYLAMLAEQ